MNLILDFSVGEKTGAANPLNGKDVGYYSAPTFGDLDHDGDLDLVGGASNGTFRVFYAPEPAQALLLGAGLALLRALDRLRRGRARTPGESILDA